MISSYYILINTGCFLFLWLSSFYKYPIEPRLFVFGILAGNCFHFIRELLGAAIKSTINKKVNR